MPKTNRTHFHCKNQRLTEKGLAGTGCLLIYVRVPNNCVIEILGEENLNISKTNDATTN